MDWASIAHKSDVPAMNARNDLVVLLERDDSLAVLARASSAARTTGQLVSMSGEAGIGKSSLLRAFAGRQGPAVRVLWGYCEALGTPRPLGPVLDMAPDLGGRTAEALADGSPRHEVFAAFVADLARSAQPIVALFEDVHWADEATLDLLQYVGRRIGHTRSVVVMSWRDDEVGVDHGIRRVLGGWAQVGVHRIQLQPLSLAAVEQLAAGARDAGTVHAVTGGNPFFVTEVISGSDDTVPASVRDAVLARRARLDADARSVLDLVSVVPLRAELGLLAALDVPPAALDTCVTAGMLRCDPLTVSFRHELARRSVADALSATRAHDCHRRVLAALVAWPDRERVLARIVHHAEACGDLDLLLAHSPAAARQAAALGAHRVAVEHYRRALMHADGLTLEAQARLTEALAYEYYLTSDIDAARTARRHALELWGRLGVPLAVGRNIRWLSRLAWFAGDRNEADRRANEAIDVLATLPESEELAMAFSNRSQLDMLRSELAPCIKWGAKAIDLARRLGANDVLSHALNNVGTMRIEAGEPEGRAQLEESLRLALASDLHEHAARAYCNLSTSRVAGRDYDEARRWLDPGILYCAGRDLDAWTLYMLAWRARLRVETGLWPSACEDCEKVLAAPGGSAVSRIPALAALALVRVRRGDLGAELLIDEALALARKNAEPHRLVPVLLARAELAWFTGRPADVAKAAGDGLIALEDGASAFDREHLWYWLWKAGALRTDEVTGEGPYAQLICGDWMAAAVCWRDMGCAFERGLALVEGDLKAVQDALDIFDTLGATPAANWARQRLRQMGQARVPRGRRASTRAHPAGLTARETEILGLLALGLRNPQIAGRVFVSPKTVEHHVSSILAKLDVPTREAAVVHARKHGWLTAIN